MGVFIASSIINARKTGLETGREKYRSYFIKLTLYKKYKEDVDAILVKNGYADCVVDQ